MVNHIIRHGPRTIDFLVMRGLEIERDCCDTPDGLPDVAARCPDCESVMMYRGVGRLRDGRLAHVFECIHSHREVHSLSILVT